MYANTGLDTGIPKQYRELEGRVHRIYLDALSETQKTQHPIDLLELLILPRNTEIIAPKARSVLERAAKVQSPVQQQETIKLVLQILTQKFSNLTYTEAQMLLDLNLPSFEETQFYKDIIQRGLQQGLQQGVEQGVQGERKKALRAIERMLHKGMDDETIMSIMDISPEELASIKQNIVL